MRAWLTRYGHLTGTALAAALALASFLIPAGLPARWTATALFMLAAPVLWRAATPQARRLFERVRPSWRELAREAWPYLIVTAGTLIAMGPVALGQPPISQDHANHYLATDILVHDLIPSARFFGWTDRIGTGYPFGDLYSTPAYLVTGLAHLVTFGLVPLPASYAFGIVLVWLIPALAATAVARRVAGPWGAAFAGLALALDAGGDREGGWVYAMFHGVWPQTLGMGVWLFAVLALWRLAEKGTTRRLAVAVLLSGVSLWMHPMNSMTILAAGVLIFAVRLFGAGRDSSPGAERGAIRIIVALFAAGIVGLVWVARMMLAKDAYTAYGALWGPLEDLMGRAAQGRLFDNQMALVSVLALMGAVRLIALGGRFRWLVLLLFAAFLVVGSMDLVMGLDLGLMGETFANMQYRRFSIPMKPLWYAMAGAGLSTVGQGLLAALATKVRKVADTPWLTVAAAVVLSPVMFALASSLPGFVKSPVARPLTLANSGEAAHVSAIRRALDDEGRRRKNGLRRAVYFEKAGYGGRYPMFAFADAGFGLLPTKIIPANNFKWVNHTTSPDAMAALGASVVVSRWPLKSPRLEELQAAGEEHVYRVKGPVAYPVSLEGGGSAQVVSWSDERRVIRVSGATSRSRLLVGQPPYRKWHATEGGRALPIAARGAFGMTLSSVGDVSDGDVVLAYRDTAVENLITVAGMLVLLAAVAGLFLKARPLPRLLGEARMATVYKGLAIAFVSVVVLGFGAAVAAGQAAVDRDWLAGERSGPSVLSVPHREGPWRVSMSPKCACVRPLTRDPSPGCAEHDLAPRLVTAGDVGGKLRSCLAIGVPGHGRTEAVFDLPSAATSVKGRLYMRSGSGVRASLAIGSSAATNISQPGKSGSPFEVAVRPGEGSVTLVLSGSSGEPAVACLELVAIRTP
ncbi:MAG: hypothetical protein PHU25_02755 [Deltaproteobacteria bacterium]|nr:hypothetical protein [Deltaproteobacteria bacterium]